jgi:hypothetical protein
MRCKPETAMCVRNYSGKKIVIPEIAGSYIYKGKTAQPLNEPQSGTQVSDEPLHVLREGG